jgi:hypothetical protein
MRSRDHIAQTIDPKSSKTTEHEKHIHHAHKHKHKQKGERTKRSIEALIRLLYAGWPGEETFLRLASKRLMVQQTERELSQQPIHAKNPQIAKSQLVRVRAEALI